MKRALTLTVLAAGFSFSAMAADVTGYIIDQMCASKADMRGDVACANKCMKGGSPAVLVTDAGKIYQIANQAKVVPQAGQKVTVTGKMKGDTITVDKIKTAFGKLWPIVNVDERLREGIRLFNEGRFFACHEILEEAWTPERGPRRLFLQAVIHVAVGLYHCQRGNPAGASSQLGKALRKLALFLPSYECIDTARLHADALVVATRLEAGSPVLEYPRISLTRL